mmetsp:Transcript_8048/g.15760  ORF Transcript_8048/g.15760 Transcript_8048/m.15760 type:complete len:203 (-) Transcript_8048:1174-1782(-)
MHFFKASKPRLMNTASLSCSPVTWLSFTCSAPPRSARIKRLSNAMPLSSSVCWSLKMSSEWARDDLSFIAVAALRFCVSPISKMFRMSLRVLASNSTRPCSTYSRAAALLFDTSAPPLSKSLTSSPYTSTYDTPTWLLHPNPVRMRTFCMMVSHARHTTPSWCFRVFDSLAASAAAAAKDPDPNIVWVLPEPVCPYTNKAQL